MIKKRLILTWLLIFCICSSMQAFRIPGFSSKKSDSKPISANSEKGLNELIDAQNKDLTDLRDKYDTKARRECPRNAEGSIDVNSKEYKKLAREFSSQHKKIRDSYVKQHPAQDSLSPKNEIDGVKNTGSDIRDIRSDVDWSADTPEAAAKKVDQWKGKNQNVIDYEYKVVNTDTGEVLWRPGYDNDPRKIADPDAFGTTGGRESTGAGGVKDPEGATLDHEKKFTAGESSGNLKEQAKATAKSGKATGRARAPENKGLYKKAKSAQRYGDDVSGGITHLGDDPAVQAQKRQKFEQNLKQEIAKNKTAGAEQSATKKKIRKNLADSAKKAETAGDKKWNEAKNKSNYDGTDTTSDAIKKRQKEVDVSNKKQAEFNEKYKKDVANAKSKSGVDADAPATKSNTPESTEPKSSSAEQGGTQEPTRRPSSDLPETKASPEVDAGGSEGGNRQSADAPETKAKTLDTDVATTKTKTSQPDAPKTKVSEPDISTKTKVSEPDISTKTKAPDIDVPKVNVEAPTVKTKLKAGAGKVLKVAGDGMQAIDIFSTAEDVKKDLEKGDIKGAAKKVATAVADEATGGLVSTGEMVLEKDKDQYEMKKSIKEANSSNDDAYDLQAQKKLRDAGVSKEDVKELVRAKENGDSGALDRKMQEMGVEAPKRIVEKNIKADDTWEERSLELQDGMVKNGKKAGKFLKNTTSNVVTIGKGLLTEKGVLKETATQSKDNAKGWLQTWRESHKADDYNESGKSDLEEYFRSRGATPQGAKKAADEMYAGNSAPAHKLDEMLKYQAAKKEAIRRGEEPPSREEWKKSRDLKQGEVKTQDVADDDQGEDAENNESLLERMSKKKGERNSKETDDSIELSGKDRDMKIASTSGDADIEEAKNILNKGGMEADEIKDQAEREVAKNDREHSWGKVVSDAAENSVIAGAKAIASTVGKGAAIEVTKQIFKEDSKDSKEEKKVPSKAISKGVASGTSSASSNKSGTSNGGGSNAGDSVEPTTEVATTSTSAPTSTSDNTSGSGSGGMMCPHCNIPMVLGNWEWMSSSDGKQTYKCPQCGLLGDPASEDETTSTTAANPTPPSTSTAATPTASPDPPAAEEAPKGWRCPSCGSYDTEFLHSSFLYGDVYHCNGCGGTVHNI